MERLGKVPFSSIAAEDKLLDFRATGVGVASSFAADSEAAFLQDAARGQVILCCAAKDGAHLHNIQEGC